MVADAIPRRPATTRHKQAHCMRHDCQCRQRCGRSVCRPVRDGAAKRGAPIHRGGPVSVAATTTWGVACTNSADDIRRVMRVCHAPCRQVAGACHAGQSWTVSAQQPAGQCRSTSTRPRQKLPKQHRTVDRDNSASPARQARPVQGEAIAMQMKTNVGSSSTVTTGGGTATTTHRRKGAAQRQGQSLHVWAGCRMRTAVNVVRLNQRLTILQQLWLEETLYRKSNDNW